MVTELIFGMMRTEFIQDDNDGFDLQENGDGIDLRDDNNGIYSG
jgi:hypothetical protein